MKAVVMAGGQGARLRPLTSNQPKPMLPVVGQPMMQHILRLARRHGVTEIVATVQFLASIVRNHFGDGSDLGLDLSYATEEEPLGTAGSVKNAAPLLEDRVLVLSGDSLTDLDLTELIRFHDEHGAAATVTLKRVPDPLEFGIVITDDQGRVERFLEKPGWGEVFSDTINTGIYVLEKEVLDLVPEGEEFDFSKQLFPLLLDKGFPIYGYVTDRYWTDVGSLPAYFEAHRAILDREVEVELEGFEVQPGIWLGEGAEVDPEAILEGPAYIGENSRVESGVTLREYTVLGRGATVRSGAYLHRAIVHDYAYIGPSTSLRGCVVAKNADVKSGAKLEDGVVVADESLIGEGAVLNPHVKVYPFKTVDPGAIVSKSIIWQSGGARGLFGDRGVAGLINVDITPEMAMRLALTYASLLPKRAVVVACRDGTRSARLLKRAMQAGLNSGGVDCHDLELVPPAVARFYARSGLATSGFTVRTSPFDPMSVEIRFFDERGIDIGPATQREVERAYYRDDLRRAFHHDIGRLLFPARGRDYYASSLLDAVDTDALVTRDRKLVVDYGFGAASVAGPWLLGSVGGEVLGVNALLDEDRLISTREAQDRHLERLAALVRSSGAELGALLDATGERLGLIDGSGRALDGRTALLAMVALVTETTAEPRVALPVATSRVAEQLVRARGGEVVWTAISTAGLMAAADQEGVAFAGDEGGGFAFPSFLPAYDGMMALVKVVELLNSAKTSLAEVVDGLPSAHIARRDVRTPWEAKGTVMRRLMERVDGDHVLTTDGIKVYRGEDWALVVPHPQEPVIRVWAEGGSDRDAESLVEEYARLVEELRA